MKIEQKKAIRDYLRQVDPKGLVVKVSPSADWKDGTVWFCDQIRQHRVETQLKGEKWVEAYLIAKLVCQMGYPASAIELQKEYPAGHPITTKPRIDIVVRDQRDEKNEAFLFIEAKDVEKYEEEKKLIEGQLFGLGDHERSSGLKYMVYYTVDFVNGRLEDRAIIIDAEQHATFAAWDMAGQPSLDQMPVGYSMAIKSVYVNKNYEDLGHGQKRLDVDVNRDEFFALRSELHNVLWGGGSATDNDVFNNLVKLFLAKIYDEEFTPEGEPYVFQIVFKDGKPQPPSEIVDKLNSKRKISDGQYEGIFRRAQKEYLEMSDEEIEASQGLDIEKISESKIAYVVERLQGISITENKNKGQGDLLGEFFEAIVRNGFKQSKGQFFTHQNIVLFCILALKLDLLVEEKIRQDNSLPYIIDPSCGSGTFLIEAMKIVTATLKSPSLTSSIHKRARQLVASWSPNEKENIWAKEYIYGIETSPDLALATKVNMVLHGDGNINILVKDGLLDFENYGIAKKVSALASKHLKPGFPYELFVNEQFDVLLSNPPFSVDLDNETKRGLMTRFQYANKRNSENLFIERWYQLLRPGGRLAVVLPESVFDTRENEYIRLFLFKFFDIKAVVSLPELAFKPWTPTRTCLLFATKKDDDDVRYYDKIWREKSKEFRRLLKGPIVSHVLRGQKVFESINRLANLYNIAIPFLPSMIETMNILGKTLANIKSQVDFDRKKHGKRADSCSKALEDWLSINVDELQCNDGARIELKKFLKDFYDDLNAGSCAADQVDRHWEEVVQVAGSSWWVFTEVAKKIDDTIHYYEVDSIGYKRTSNREKETNNELFITDGEKISLTDLSTVLGDLRDKVEY